MYSLRSNLFGNRQPPLLGIVEFRIDVEDHAAKRKNPVADDLADLKFGDTRFHGAVDRPGLWLRLGKIP